MARRRLLELALGVLAAVVVAQAALLGFLMVRSSWQRKVSGTAVIRGRLLAEAAGCFGCHGPGGARPIPNPGSTSGEVPGWVGGTWMMWNRSEEDVRGWIAEGHPVGRAPDPGALIQMPAYGERLSAREIDDLTAYVLSVSLFGWPQDPRVAQGREVAVRFGCFGCHGPEGRGLTANPGSLKGYVPPWDGDDYSELVRDDEEFRQWVRNGITDRFRANPAARRILTSQAIPMPAYGDRVTPEEIEALLAYVRWVRENPRGRP